MNVIFRLVIIISVSVCFSLNCYSASVAQMSTNSSKTIDSLNTRLGKLEKVAEEGSYTRIPNKDFENIIDNKIQKSMRDTVNWWLIVIAALVSVLGFLVNKYAKAYLKNIINTKVNQLKKENEEKIESLTNQHFATVINTLVEFKIESITKRQNMVEEVIVDDLKKFLTDESKTISEYNKVLLIDTIMRCYYYSNFAERIEKMIELIKEYEEKFTLRTTTYVNAAIAFCDMYERFGAKDFLNSAIENCNKSIKILPDYGLAFAQKLELYMMAISKAFDTAERKLYENELFRVFKDIENNTSTALCSELIDRLDIDKNYFARPYIETLYHDYADEMAKITARAIPVSQQIVSEEDTATF